MQVNYYPGCTMKASARQYETSALAVLRALSIEPHEMENWNCCGVSHSLTSDNLIRHVAPVRVFTRLQEQGSHEVVTFCDMCYNTLARTNELVRQQPAASHSINDFIDSSQSYDGQIEVLHLLQILRDRVGFKAIKKRVKHPLKGLTVFPYYGCKLLRPGEVGIDDAETPTILRDLMQALGARVVDDPIQVQCCGSYHVVNHDAIVSQRVQKIAARAQALQADAIVLSCPLCHFNLDTRQALNESPLPVFYYTQLVGIAFGLEQELLGLETHRINPLVLLNERNLMQGHRASDPLSLPNQQPAMKKEG